MYPGFLLQDLLLQGLWSDRHSITHSGLALKLTIFGLMWIHSFIFSVTMVNITKDAGIALLNKQVENVPRHAQTVFYVFSS